MLLNEIDKVLSQLEMAELEAPDGYATPQIYAHLLAIYLYQNQLCYAKYLWKRIPQIIKNSTSELHQIWAVGQKMWQRDWPGVHAALKVEWSEDVAEIMNALKENVRERAMVLISEAYSSVHINVLAAMTGLSTAQAQQAAIERGWTLDRNIVQPCKPDKEQNSGVQETRAEDQLYELTQFVSFLEN